ncbi:uncharacterized protein LOC115627342 [Scaptodrosophila lebanonensis]|uniref:Uncharacterized protein LOC115627342 n=1 Tax=Drosophila lebanonensis TaxID=7225 RepID=A0A6J2TUN2_DROLE|nr:uncharacterized protein LOC115627342 [Scaptodrosophila lebanonensis]
MIRIRERSHSVPSKLRVSDHDDDVSVAALALAGLRLSGKVNRVIGNLAADIRNENIDAIGNNVVLENTSAACNKKHDNLAAAKVEAKNGILGLAVCRNSLKRKFADAAYCGVEIEDGVNSSNSAKKKLDFGEV